MPAEEPAEAETNRADDSQTLFGAKRCFIAAPIGVANSDTRRRSDLVKEYIIDEAMKPLGYATIRADEVEKSGAITTQIVGDLIEADLLIADLTDHNANVFYELAIRHAFKKPYIQLIEEGQDIPFDVRAFRTVIVDHRDLASAANARKTITAMVRDIEAGSEVESPVVHAVTRQQLEGSADPRSQELAQIGDAVERIDRRIRIMESEKPERPGRNPLQLEMMRVIAALAEAGKLEYEDVTRMRKFTNRDPEVMNWFKHLDQIVPPF